MIHLMETGSLCQGYDIECAHYISPISPSHILLNTFCPKLKKLKKCSFSFVLLFVHSSSSSLLRALIFFFWLISSSRSLSSFAYISTSALPLSFSLDTADVYQVELKILLLVVLLDCKEVFWWHDTMICSHPSHQSP